ncbi:MAG TPA: helix-turn-helix domain-containing protein [Planctomycetota bacterium]|jgi:excisionase family DNA binding protein|nr:helix-turn-helix domain-containing protein [Planctomycetota bacterium]
MPRTKKASGSSNGAWLTFKEAANRAGLSYFTLYKMNSTGKLPVKMRKIEGKMRLDRAAFEDWLKSRSASPGGGRGRRGGRRGAGRAAVRRVRGARRGRPPAAAVGAPRGRRAGGFSLPVGGATNLDFWFRLLGFVRGRGATVSIQTDGSSVSLV